MALAIPKILALDSSTLGVVSRDYWSRDERSRAKARFFLAQLLEHGVYIALTFTHVSELLRHANEQIVQDRIRFLRSLRLVAWLRPYNLAWFPGAIPDLLTRELHAVVHYSARSWREIIQKVRPELWETGAGCEVFVENPQLWSFLQSESRRQHEHEKYVASVARTHPVPINDLKLGDALDLPRRSKKEYLGYIQRFAAEMKRQLDRHGDKRLEDASTIATDFANGTLKDYQVISTLGGDPIQRLLELSGVPTEFINREMTIGELGELTIYACRLRDLGNKLRPPVTVRMQDVPPRTLPSHVMERALASLQDRASRVSGSDLERVLNFRHDSAVQAGWQGSPIPVTCQTRSGHLSLRT